MRSKYGLHVVAVSSAPGTAHLANWVWGREEGVGEGAACPRVVGLCVTSLQIKADPRRACLHKPCKAPVAGGPAMHGVNLHLISQPVNQSVDLIHSWPISSKHEGSTVQGNGSLAPNNDSAANTEERVK